MHARLDFTRLWPGRHAAFRAGCSWSANSAGVELPSATGSFSSRPCEYRCAERGSHRAAPL